jgi:hypothetical protein
MFEDIYGMLLLIAATITQSMADLGTWLAGLVKVHPVISEVLVFVVIIVLLGWGFKADQHRRRKNFWNRHRCMMTKEEHAVLTAIKVASKVSEALDQLLYDGEITLADHVKYYKRLGDPKGLDLPELRRSKIKLTEAQREGLKEMAKIRGFLGSEKPTIPGPKPGEDVVVTQPKKAGGWAERFLNRTAKSA